MRIDQLHTPTIMTLDQAIELAAVLNEDPDDAWHYVVNATGNRARVDVYNEEGEFIDSL